MGADAVQMICMDIRILKHCVPLLFFNPANEGNTMKHAATLSLILALSASSLAFGHSGGMKDMEMKDQDMQKCMDMKGMDMKGMDMKGMDMKGMDMQKCMEMMNGKDSKQQSKSDKAMPHKTTAVVKSVDAANGKVTLAHEPVKSLNWPAMTMGFAVKDNMLLDKLAVGKKVNVEFIQQGSDYVVTAVK
ncbi:MAG: copper-binding protein [Noviherbaspirillum sp.]